MRQYLFVAVGYGGNYKVHRELPDVHQLFQGLKDGLKSC